MRECRSRQLLSAIINFLSPLKILEKKKPYLKSSILKAYLKEDILKINFPLFVVLISQKINQYFRSELAWREEKREGYHLPFGLTLKDNFSIFPSLLRALSPQHLLNFVSGYSKMHLSAKYLLCPPDQSLPQILTITPPRQGNCSFPPGNIFLDICLRRRKGRGGNC